MSTAPDLCPDCLRAGVVATRTGPTCTHHADHDAKWFPPLWGPANQNQGMNDRERLAWLRHRQTQIP